MASDFDVSPAPPIWAQSLTPDLTAYALADSDWRTIRRVEDVNCLLSQMFTTADIEEGLCAGDFVGARSLSWGVTNRIADSYFSVADSLPAPILQTYDALLLDSSDRRPQIPIVPQRTVPETKPVVSDPAAVSPVAVKPVYVEPVVVGHIVVEASRERIVAPDHSVAGAATTGPTTSERSNAAVAAPEGVVRPANYVASRKLTDGVPLDVAGQSAIAAQPKEPVQLREQPLSIEDRQSSHDLHWTNLLASDYNRNAYMASVATVPAQDRPHLMALPTMVGESESRAFKAPLLESPEQQLPTVTVEPLLEELHDWEIPMQFVKIAACQDRDPQTIVLEEVSPMPLGVSVPVDDDHSSRPSRYWFLAAIPAFFSLPRRRREPGARELLLSTSTRPIRD